MTFLQLLFHITDVIAIFIFFIFILFLHFSYVNGYLTMKNLWSSNTFPVSKTITFFSVFWNINLSFEVIIIICNIGFRWCDEENR